MAKITVEELFYGDKYAVMGEVVKQVFARQDEFVAARRIRSGTAYVPRA